MERAAGFAAEDDTEARLDKLEGYLRRFPGHAMRTTNLFAALLSLPGEARYGDLGLSSQQQQDETIAALLDQLCRLSEDRPVFVVLEDAHWLDPTTEGLVCSLVAGVAQQRIFFLITHRGEYTPPWIGPAHVTPVNLTQLSNEDIRAIVKAIGGDRLEADVVDQIVARADGIPLYVEELTKSILKTNGGGAEIPVSLQASLVARIDHLGEAGRLAQLAATLGRSFPYRVIKAVSGLDAGRFDQALSAMLAAGLLLQSNNAPEPTYTFKHALIQDAAYETQLRSSRQETHEKVAEVLSREFADLSATSPGLVARHRSLAGRAGKAVESWLAAGKRVGERSEHFEVIALLEQGLANLEGLVGGDRRREMEFAIRIALGASLLSVKG